jgi:hypothetical protein
MLIDLDLAIVDGERTGGRHMTGTMKFMAIDVLCEVEHTYRHDLESFFYVLLWICACRAWEREFYCKCKDRLADNVLGDWYGDTNKKIVGNKQGSMYVDGFENILKEFSSVFDYIKSLCREVRIVLFSLIKDEKLDFETLTDLNILYKLIIKAFEDVIAELDINT